MPKFKKYSVVNTLEQDRERELWDSRREIAGNSLNNI
jgi:hypothetical protein